MADFKLAGCTAVVTGAGSGLGAAMVDRFAAQGMAIAALDIDESGAEATVHKVRERGCRAIGIRVDVADKNSLEAAAHTVKAEFGSCNILCANVGVQQFGAIDKLSDQDWRRVLDVNVLGVIHTVNAFLPLVRKREGMGHLVVTSSSAVLTPGIRMAAYTTSKYAVTGYAETLRMELAEEHIGVSILFPAGMSTRHLESSVKARPAERGTSELRREDIDAMMASRGMDASNHLATAEYATRHLLEDIQANERFIITHGEYRGSLEANAEAIFRAHDRAQVK